ncbi:MAG TPA: very short patch repair endonuclease [Solirubrobacterales bacterium]
MRANQRVDTAPELALRSELQRRGLRFRKDLLLRFDGGRVRPDVAFTRAKVAVFIDGCFWHRCPDHGQIPKANHDYWGPKLARNVERDLRNDALLEREGWKVLRFFEHVPAEKAAQAVEETVRLSQKAA